MLVCEVAFTLLAVPVLGGWDRGRCRCTRCGLRPSRCWCWALPSTARPRSAPSMLRTCSPQCTSPSSSPRLAFVLWYSAVARIGAARAGLFTGFAPVAAAVGGVLLGGQIPAPSVWAGVAVVALGLVLGLGAPDESVRAGVRNTERTASGRVGGARWGRSRTWTCRAVTRRSTRAPVCSDSRAAVCSISRGGAGRGGGGVRRSALVGVGGDGRGDEGLLDRAGADPAQQVVDRARLVVRARRPTAAERLLADHRAGRLVVDVEVARPRSAGLLTPARSPRGRRR